MSKKRRRTSGKVSKTKSALHQIKQLIKRGNLDSALLLLEGMKGGISEAKYASALAELHFRRAHHDAKRYPKQALKDFEQAVSLQPSDTLYRYHLALFQHGAGQLKKAITGYRSVLEQDAKFDRALLPLAFALQASGETLEQDAIWNQLSAHQQALFTFDASSSNKLMQAMVAVENQEWQQAQEIFKMLVEDKNSTSYAQALAHDHLGRLALQIDGDNLELALSHWHKAYQLGLRTDTLVENLSLVYTLYLELLIQENDSARALKHAQEALDYFPEHTRLQEIQAHLLLEAGYEQALNNDWGAALKYWDEVINAEGEVARRLFANMAIAYEKLEVWDKAADSWREFARRRGRKEGAVNWLSPEQVARLWSRISSLYMRAGMEDDAIATLQTALKYDPDDLEMGVDLARRYAEAGRVDASHNQINRVIKKHPKSAKAYAFKAEVAEIAPQGWYFINHQAINAWEKVIELKDESFDVIALQRLEFVYLEAFAHFMSSGFKVQQGLNFAQEKLEKFPQYHLFRADYIAGLFTIDADEALIQEQLDLIDVTHQLALVHLINMCHYYDQDDKADMMLKRASEATVLDANFYTLIGQGAIKYERPEMASIYFAESLKRVDDDDDRLHIQVQHASSYLEFDMEKEGETILKDILKRHPDFGPAHLSYAILYMGRSNTQRTKFYLSKAEKWAKANKHPEMLRIIEDFRFQIDNPLASMLPPGFDPSMLPPGMDIEDVINLLAGLGFDDDEDEEGYW